MHFDEVWLRYARRGPWVLRAVEVRIAPGGLAVVLGGNGVGKSTLLQIAAGVLRPTRGTLRDRPGRVGWVPERFPADQPFTVQSYLLAMARMRGLSALAAGRVIDGWTERLGITGYRDVRLPELSKGTAQKVGLAQALLVPPELLVLDEPWEGLDAAARELVPTLVGEVCQAGGIVLVSDHRGETLRLPDADRWTVADGTVTAQVALPAQREPGEVCVVEVGVPAAQLPGAVATFRAAGHQILRVRRDTSPAAPPGADPLRAVDDPSEGPS